MAAHNTLARLSLLSGLGLTFQQGPGVLFPSACLISKVCDLFAQGSCIDAAPTFLPLSLEVFVQPKGIVPESAVLVRSFSLVFSYLCTQRCGTVCECRESLLSHPFSYEAWWNRARYMRTSRDIDDTEICVHKNLKPGYGDVCVDKIRTGVKNWITKAGLP